MMDLFSFEKDFYDRMKQLFNMPCDSYELKLWENGKLIYDSTKDNKQLKPNNNVPKNIKGDYDLSIHGNKIVLVDNKDGTTVEAKCHPDDNFDIGTGIDEAFKKLNEKRKADEEACKAIKVGDMVEVVNNGQTYSTYTDWCYKNLPFNLVKQYAYGITPYTGTVGKVMCIAPHLVSKNSKVVAIQDNKNCIYLIGEHGLKKVID